MVSACFTSDQIKDSGRTSSKIEADYDRTLIHRFRNGDKSAFDEIIMRYREKLHGLALRFLNNKEDAEEVVQDALIGAYRNLAEFRGDSSLATWLHTITFNFTHKKYWYNTRRHYGRTLSMDATLNVEMPGGKLGDIVVDSYANPAQICVSHEISTLVCEGLKGLRGVHREILTLRIIKCYSYRKVAEILRLNIGTVKSRIARARNLLLNQMRKLCPDFKGKKDFACLNYPRMVGALHVEHSKWR